MFEVEHKDACRRRSGRFPASRAAGPVEGFQEFFTRPCRDLGESVPPLISWHIRPSIGVLLVASHTHTDDSVRAVSHRNQAPSLPGPEPTHFANLSFPPSQNLEHSLKYSRTTSCSPFCTSSLARIILGPNELSARGACRFAGGDQAFLCFLNIALDHCNSAENQVAMMDTISGIAAGSVLG